MICDRFKIADIFGVSADTVRNWHRDGCPSHREPKGGKGVTSEEKARLYNTVAVHKWLSERRRKKNWW